MLPQTRRSRNNTKEICFFIYFFFKKLTFIKNRIFYQFFCVLNVKIFARSKNLFVHLKVDRNVVKNDVIAEDRGDQ